MVGCNLRQKQLQQGQHLENRCKLWAPTWQKEVSSVPEAGQQRCVTTEGIDGIIRVSLF